MGGNREELAVWQLHPRLCRREEGGAQPRPLVTRCHRLLPRRRLAQTMASRWRGGPGQPQSLAYADTYCPRPTLLGWPIPGPFTEVLPSPSLNTTGPCSLPVSAELSHFSVRAAAAAADTSYVSCLPPCPSSSFVSLSAHNYLDYRMGHMCGMAGTPFYCPVESVWYPEL